MMIHNISTEPCSKSFVVSDQRVTIIGFLNEINNQLYKLLLGYDYTSCVLSVSNESGRHLQKWRGVLWNRHECQVSKFQCVGEACRGLLHGAKEIILKAGSSPFSTLIKHAESCTAAAGREKIYRIFGFPKISLQVWPKKGGFYRV